MMTWQKFQEPSIYEFYDAKSLDPHVDAGWGNAGLNSASANQEPDGQLSEDKVDVLYQTNYLLGCPAADADPDLGWTTSWSNVEA